MSDKLKDFIHKAWLDVPVVGILGGGQLARMLCQAASRIGISTVVLEKSRQCPAYGVATHFIEGDWNNAEEIIKLSRQCDVITLESEFIEASVLDRAKQSGAKIIPSPETIRTVQDKFLQKSALESHGVKLPCFESVESEEDILQLGNKWGWPLVLKTRKLGYDGKGNTTVKNAEDVPRAWQTLSGDNQPLYCEEFIHFERELAIMVCITQEEECELYPLVQTIQKNHICHEVLCPCEGEDHLINSAKQLAELSVRAVGGMGCFGVEMFENAEGELLVNELAPRVHNSGHYTIEACQTSQFENHIRSILGISLGSTKLIHPSSVMVNILGEDEGQGWPSGLLASIQSPDCYLHWYGKLESKIGRKMGHVTSVGSDLNQCRNAARQAVEIVYETTGSGEASELSNS